MLKWLYGVTACFVFTLSSNAQWNNDAAVNTLQSSSAESELNPVAVSDNAGGSIVVTLTDNNYILAQRINVNGLSSWGGAYNPVVVCNVAATRRLNQVIADGSGGVYISWSDYRHDASLGEIYMQHLSSSGTALWAVNGLRVTSTATNDDYDSFLCSDGAGGVIVCWNWDNQISNAQSDAQRLTATGIALWPAGGVTLSTAAGFRACNGIAPDGNAGAIVFFTDSRNDPNGLNYSTSALSNIDLYAQKIDAAGNRLWTANGAAACTAAKNQFGNFYYSAVSDGAGGAVMAFFDSRNDVPTQQGDPTNFDVYATRMAANGTALWTTEGKAVTTAANNQYFEMMIADGSGGAVISYSDENEVRIYAQRLNAAGTMQWGSGLAAAVSAAAEDAETTLNGSAFCTMDGAGAFLFVYKNTANDQVKAQKLNSTGVMQWGASGIVVCNLPAANPVTASAVLSNNGGLLACWQDNRNVLAMKGFDVYAAKLLTGGTLAGGPVHISTANGNWNNGSTWSGGIVPPANAAVIVRHAVAVTANASCASLRIEPASGNVSVNPGVLFSVNQIAN